MQAAAFVAHPYQFPTIGWPADIQSWQLEDLQKFFRTYYAPNNQTLVLAGDVDRRRKSSRSRASISSRFRARQPRRRCCTREPEQLAERRVVVRRSAQTPLLQYAYKAPAAADERAPALSLLLSILVDGDASRLYRLLVEETEARHRRRRALARGVRSGAAVAVLHAAGRRGA